MLPICDGSVYMYASIVCLPFDYNFVLFEYQQYATATAFDLPGMIPK